MKAENASRKISSSRELLAAGERPRIYYVHPLLAGSVDGWCRVFDHAATLGFNSILTAPPFATGPSGSVFLPRSLDRLHPSLGISDAVEGLGRLSEEAAARGLAFGLDLVVDRISPGSAFEPELRSAASAPEILDPRESPAFRGALAVRFDGSDDAAGHYLERLSQHLGRLAQAGVTRFRCLNVDRVPVSAWSKIIGSVHAHRPDAQCFAWTPGVAYDDRRALQPAGFDGVFSSLCWWDFRSSWLVDEHDLHRSLGFDIAFPETPFENRLAHDAESLEVLERRAVRALRLSAAFGDGLLVPMGFEFGCRDRFDPLRGDGSGVAGLRERGDLDLLQEVCAANALVARREADFTRRPIRVSVNDRASVTAVLRGDAEDERRAARASLILVNLDLRRSAEVTGSAVMADAGGRFAPYHEGAGREGFGPAGALRLAPGEVRVLDGRASEAIIMPGPGRNVAEAVQSPRLVIEDVSPVVDGGLFPVKRTVGEVVRVEADVFGDGHDLVQAALLWRPADEVSWRETRMTLVANDRWTAHFALERLGPYEFVIEAWRDPFAIFRSELTKKHEAGLDVTLELEEGRLLVEETLDGNEGEIAARVQAVARALAEAGYDQRLAILLDPDTSAVMTAADRRPFRVRSKAFPVDAERAGAGFASWYELFPRSMSGDPNRHGTFDDVIGRLPAIRAMGFDVLYLTPIHPIGRTHRKGKNNSLTAGPDDPGSPYAIGSEAGGHDAIHPELGTFEDFRRLVAAAAEHGLELALDIAVQASPDHPWLKEHPDWFDWRPDGTIKYAENPPKKYEDIVNVDFYAKGAVPSLWVELRDVFLVWVDQGIKLFRVDNPHTKPLPFWEWLIADIRRRHPDVVFLAEAFTRPKVMYRLAKIGFSQSYTYFTWRNAKWELTEYLTELSQTPPKEFFRPHFFVNTPDINPDFLQNAPRAAYLIRTALATTLSGLWGMYSGFELCEGRPDVKKKEYADSEKYEIKAWDWDRPGNIISEIAALNRIRRDNPALHSHLGVDFLPAWNENVLFFEKASPGRENVLLIAIGLDPHHVHEADVELPLWKFGLPDHAALAVEDLVRDQRFTWTGKYQRVRCDPTELPFSVWRVTPKDN